MSGRRSHRSRKSIDYSKLSSDKEDIDLDDDDFIKTTPSKKRKERDKPKDNSQDVASDKNKTAPVERRARNRLSEEEKYNKQLEEALKLSIIDASKSDETGKPSDKDANVIQHDACVPLTVRVEVMDSPMSKHRKNMELTEKARNPNLSNCVKNGAILPGSDRITPVPTKDITAKPLNSRRCRKAVTKRDDDDYKFSEESESNEDDDETFEDFQDVSPVKKKKRAVSTKSSLKKENKATPKTTITKNAVKSEKPLPTFNSEKMQSDPRKVCTKTMPSASPMTPKSNKVLSVKSPSLLQKKFIQRGWTPPGPAGMKTSTLKSSPSPSCIRVGLSRNARISPLHPRTIIR